MIQFFLLAGILASTLVSDLQAGTQVVWKETSTHRIKIKSVDGVEVGRWEFPKKPSKPSPKPSWRASEEEVRKRLALGSSGWAAILEAPKPGKGLERALTRDFMKAHTKSHMRNAYSPLQKAISFHADALKNLDPKLHARGRKILYDVISRLDTYQQGAIPNFLYEALGDPLSQLEAESNADSPRKRRALEHRRRRARQRRR